MKELSVSVVISVYNRKDLMKKTIDAMLRSDYKNYEIVAVDGGSTDGTLEMLNAYAKKSKRLKILVDKTPGRNAARNTGIDMAKGEIVIFVDSDCIVEKNWMEEIVKPFSDKSVGGVIGRTAADKKGLFWYHMENDYLQFIGHNSAYRMSIIKKIGGFDKRFKIAREDTDLAWSVIESGYKMVYCEKARMTHISKKVSVFYRIKNQRTFLYDGLLIRKHAKLYKKYFYKNGMPATIWPSVFSPFLLLAFLYSAAFYATAAIFIVLIYLIIAGRKLVEDKDGSIGEKLKLLIFIWIIPLSRFYYFTKGYIKFRKADIK